MTETETMKRLDRMTNLEHKQKVEEWLIKTHNKNGKIYYVWNKFLRYKNTFYKFWWIVFFIALIIGIIWAYILWFLEVFG